MNLKKTKLLSKIFLVLIGIYIAGLTLIYFNQEKFIFLPTKLDQNYVYHFQDNFEEINLKTSDDININALLFKTDNPKGVIYYLHGNSGNLSGWGDLAGLYLELGYDFFVIDYRGFGKSGGKISNEQEFYSDAQLGYDFIKNSYRENEIVIIGYSIGTGAASYLASKNSPKLLILQAPYYNLTEISKTRMPFVPSFLLKYKFENNVHLNNTDCPVYIFHGDKDQTIFYEDAVKLKEHLKEKDEYITLKGQRHNGINENVEFIEKSKVILSSNF